MSQSRVEDALRTFEDAGGDPRDPRLREPLVALAEHASALLPLAVRDPDFLEDVLARPLERPDEPEVFRHAFERTTAHLEDGPELRQALRQQRHRAMVRIALREVLRLADIDQTSAEMAWLADAAIDAALAACSRTVTRMWGEPVDAEGHPVPLVVLGMGKLGGEELNLGSDVDLIFFYGTDDAEVPGGERSVNEVFAKVASRTAKALADVTEDGFCFRVDLRLRPEGSRGPLVNSLVSAERYYETWGRTWERAALLRARPVAGSLAFGEELLTMLRPFVFRRAVDPSIADEMTEMVRKSRRDLRADPERDIKLGHGGIREAEFFVQALQLIWGGQHPELQVTNTVEAVRRLWSAGLVSDREAADLEQGWALLRRIEHRIHVQAGYQTHSLPEAGGAKERFARSLGFEDAAGLDQELDAARGRIRALFESLSGEEERRDEALVALCDRVASGASASEIAEAVPGVLPAADPDEAASHLIRLGRRATSPFGPVNRERMPDLGPLLLEEVRETADPDAALRFLADFFARLGGPWGYDKLFLEQPRLARRLIGLFGASATLSSAFVAHPEAVDELLVSAGPPSPSDIRRVHVEGTLDFVPERADEPPDPESFVAALRSRKRDLTLQIGLAYVAGEIELEGVTLLLTILAEAQIDAAVRYAHAERGTTGGLSVVGLGKLGGRELGFGGDLDLVFLYGEDGEVTLRGRETTWAEVYTRVAQRAMRLLSQPDAEGPGYETDTRLRPSGSRGMLVVSLDAFDRYHEKQAQGWERQALVRARPVAGDPGLGEDVRERTARVAFEGGPIDGEEMARLRRRIEEELAGERADRYHPKLGYGALVDVEFVVQALQMRHGSDPEVRSPNTMEALDALGRRGVLEEDETEVLREGYRFFRCVEQDLKLLDETREPVLHIGGRVAEQVARRLALRDRDGQRVGEVLEHTWQRYGEAIRAVFDRRVAPVGTAPPWEVP